MTFFSSSRAFLKGLFLNPRAMGAVVPSSPYLAEQMASCIDIAQPGFVLEFGPGTGVVTKAILATGISPHQLITLELANHFATELRIHYPGILVIEGDAKNASALIDGKTIHTVISSLPLRSLSKEDRDKILTEVSTLLASNGRFIQFTYALRDKHTYVPKDMTLIKSFIVWRNFPPARVNVFRKH